jgi:hypothetical protein
MIPVVGVDGREVPILIQGTSPFIGAGQFGFRARLYREKFYSNPTLMAEFFVYFSSKCYPCVHITAHPPIIEAMEIASEIRSISVIATIENERDLELIARFDPVIVFLHASITDLCDEEKIVHFSDGCRDLGFIPGLATHNPGRILPAGFEGIKAYMVPINPLGLYMSPSFDSALIAIEKARKENKFIVGMKTLAAGRINPYKGFPFALKYAHSIVVGFTELEQIDEACRLVEKIAGERLRAR